MRAFNRALRNLSAVTLFFFSWTFLPLWQVAAWAAEPPQKTVGKNQGPGSSVQRPATTGERFEKALEAIRENVDLSEKKQAKGEDDAVEREHIRTKRAEIDTLDGELKKEFAATEKKLRDAKLPQEILDRHAKFVKHYEDNLKELKTNLDDVEKATTKADRKAKIAKAKAHLEKTKAPSKHVPLDPNKLPNRMVKGKERAPRLKKEEFEKEFGPQKKAGKLAGLQADFATDERGLSRILNSALQHATSRFTSHVSPILLAYNGPASDMPLDLPRPSGGEGWGEGRYNLPEFAFSDLTQNSELGTLNLAQASTDAPTAADLAETPEVQFTPEIQAKAAELGHNPVKIYEWVRNNIEFVPTYGSIQGAQMTLETKLGNAFDTASLLIALYRASGIPARYVYGTVEIPIEQAMNWVGGVTDPKMVGTIFATNGVPVTLMKNSGSVYKAVQLEHVFVKAFVDYIPSRGAVNKQGDTWIPLDPSFKQYTYTEGIDIKSAVPFDPQNLINQIKSTATINETEGFITNVDTGIVQRAIQDYQVRVQEYVSVNYPKSTIKDFVGAKTIIKTNMPYLMGTLPYYNIQGETEWSAIPVDLCATMRINIQHPTNYASGLSHQISIRQGVEENITLSFSPATIYDQKMIELYLPTLPLDNSPILPNELPSSLPSYLINLKPELRIKGQIVTTGAAINMGETLPLTIVVNEPGIGESIISNVITAGQYIAIGLDTGRIGIKRLNDLKNSIKLLKAKIEAQNYEGVTGDSFVGGLFSAIILHYFSALDSADEMEAKRRNIVRYRTPSIGMFGLGLNVQRLFGMARSVSPDSMIMDVDRIMQAVFSKDGNQSDVRKYMIASGARSSALEHKVPEHAFSMPDGSIKGISAVKALQLASSQGIPVYSISSDNASYLLPKLQLSSEIIADIANAINAGKVVAVSKTNINFAGWSGCGYIILDPVTGAGAYLISGIYNGMKLLGATLYLLAITFFLVAILSAETIVGPIIFGTLGLLASYGMIIALYGREKADEFVLCVLAELFVLDIEDILLDGAAMIAEFMGSAIASYFSGLSWVVTGAELIECISELQSIDPIIDPIPYQYA